jgi:hypothetical protein
MGKQQSAHRSKVAKGVKNARKQLGKKLSKTL